MNILDEIKARRIFAEADKVLKKESCDYLVFTRKDPTGLKETVDITIEKIETRVGNEKMGYHPAKRIIIHLDDEVVYAADKIEGVSFEVIKQDRGDWVKAIHQKYYLI